MKTIHFLLVILFSMSVVVAGNIKDSEKKQKETLINGKVTDRLTGENLAGVKITIQNTDIVSYTDFDGNFMLQVPAGAEGTVLVSYISYESVRLEISDFSEKSIIQILPLTR
jgi:hypothetical protein